MVRRFGVFEFHPDVTLTEIDEVFLTMKSMEGQIDGLLSMEYGPYNGSEGLNGDFSHGCIMTFTDEAARDAYLQHPVFEEVKAYVVSKLTNYLMFDFKV